MKLIDLINKNFKFDKRVIELGLKQGAFTKNEYKDHLKNLQDVSNNKEELSVDSNVDTDSGKK